MKLRGPGAEVEAGERFRGVEEVRIAKILRAWFLEAMQTRTSLLNGERPCCPLDPKHRIHRHGGYWRFANCHENTKSKWIARFLCYRCGHTISVLPEDTLPYRPLSVSQVQESFDAKTSAVPQPATHSEVERDCLKRAWTRFRQRVDGLLAVLGQMIEKIKPNANELWDQLRRLGTLERILHLLGAKFKTSLLGDYRCLKPWPPRL